MKANGPSYDLSDLINACARNKSGVRAIKGAVISARKDFNLKTEREIVDFIGAGGLQTPKFKNTDTWQNNPDPPPPIIMVDAYTFSSGSISGYIAFLFQKKTDKWIIKSFKLNSRRRFTALAFRKALSGLKGDSDE